MFFHQAGDILFMKGLSRKMIVTGGVPVNLLFAIDKGFIDLFLNCIQSIVTHGGDHAYAAYILHSDLDEAAMGAISQAVGNSVDCRFIAVDPALFAGFPESRRYPLQIYYRLAAPLLLPGHLDRILYLDVDTIVVNPLDPLYEMDFAGAWYIACTHTREFLTRFNQARLGVKKDVPYINTGVMMLNLPELRKKLRMDDIRRYASERMHTFILPDQDIITALYGENVKLADTMRYNLSDRILALYNADPKNEKVDLEWVRANTVIIHYCGKNKPWKDGYIGILGGFYRELCLSHPRGCSAERGRSD